MGSQSSARRRSRRSRQEIRGHRRTAGDRSDKLLHVRRGQPTYPVFRLRRLGVDARTTCKPHPQCKRQFEREAVVCKLAVDEGYEILAVWNDLDVATHRVGIGIFLTTPAQDGRGYLIMSVVSSGRTIRERAFEKNHVPDCKVRNAGHCPTTGLAPTYGSGGDPGG